MLSWLVKRRPPATELPEGFKYRAFLSYRGADRKLAEKLVRRLESYRTPKPLVGKQGRFGLVPHALGPICQDRQEFPTSTYLDLVIAEKLTQSRMLAVLCSPAAAAEESWVTREIELFREKRPDGPIHAIIGWGDPPGCFPAALLVHGDHGSVKQPLAADMRRAGDGTDKAIIKLLAGILGVDFDDLWRRERRRRMARVVWGSIASVIGLAALGFALVWVNTQDWRGELSTHAERVAGEGQPFDALAFALAGEPSRGSLVAARSARADATLESLGRIPTLAEVELGPANVARLSLDGRMLLNVRGGSHLGAYDLVSAAQIDMGPFIDIRFSERGNFLIAEDREHRIVLIDPSHGARRTEWTGLPFNTYGASVSADGSTLLAVSEGRFRVFDVDTAQLKGDLGPTGNQINVLSPQISVNGAFVVLGLEGERGVLYDLRAPGSPSQTDLGRISGFALSPNGNAMLVIKDRRPHFFDLRNGSERADFGDRVVGWGPQLSEDGKIFVLLPNDSTIIAYNFDDGSVTELNIPEVGEDPPLFWLSRDGGTVVVLVPTRHGIRDFVWAYDLRRGGLRTEIESIDNRRYIWLSPNGQILVTQANDYQTTAHDLRRHTRIDLGELLGVEFSGVGARLLAYTRSRATVMDFDHPLWELHSPPSGGDLAVAACDGHRRVIRPFSSNVRGGEREQISARATNANLRAVSQHLRGRPWNPCDWRGLAAIFPNQDQGDDWFEGLRQWWRMIRIRFLGHDDWRCEETTSRASHATRARRRELCDLQNSDTHRSFAPL